MLTNYTRFHAKILALVAWADGGFDIQEERLYLAILEASTGSEELKTELAKYLDEPPDMQEVLQEVHEVPKRTVANVLRNAYLISLANEELHGKEEEVLNAIAKEIGLTEEQFPRLYDMMRKYYETYKIEEELFYK